MYRYYILGGSNAYHAKEEIKELKPFNKKFKNWWKYNYDFKAWELDVPNSFNTKSFENSVKEFCSENELKLEILQDPSKVTKSIKDFVTLEEYFEYFHKNNEGRNL